MLECFLQGGLLEINRAREFVQASKGKWEETLRRLNALGLLLDEYYIDEKFVRVLVLPAEIFQHLQDYPILEKKKATKRTPGKARDQRSRLLSEPEEDDRLYQPQRF